MQAEKLELKSKAKKKQYWKTKLLQPITAVTHNRWFSVSGRFFSYLRFSLWKKRSRPAANPCGGRTLSPMAPELQKLNSQVNLLRQSI
jgi:hypothetical protein